jgi:type IV pilus assembly protein PilA
MFKNKKGFTLVELIIVIAILALLVALLAPNLIKYIEKSKVAKDIQTLDAVLSAIEAELADPDMNTFSTVYNGKILPVYLYSFDESKNATGFGKGDFRKLDRKLFDDDIPALTGAFKNITVTNRIEHNLYVNYTEAFCSKTVQDKSGKIVVFLNGNGGIAVAAWGRLEPNKSGIITYDGKELIVMSKINREDLDTSTCHSYNGVYK